ncbi:hypothetical protein PRIC1_014755 [Phytophthora ramorum]
MRLIDVCLLAIALILFTSCDAATDSNQAKDTVLAIDALPMARLLTTDDNDNNNSQKLLRSHHKTGRSDAKDYNYDDPDSEDSAENEEERGIIPSGLATQLQNLKTPGLPASVSTFLEKLKTEGFTKTALALIKKLDISNLPAKIKRYLIKIKNNVRTYFRNVYWHARFVIWMKKKQNPSIMYEKLKVRETTGPADKNYRIYNEYFRTYEHFYGPTFDPRHVYGPKVEIV